MNALSLLRQSRRYLGLTGTLGAGLLAISAAAYFLAVVPAQHRAAALGQQLRQAESAVETPAENHPADAAADITAFYERFADISSLPGWLDALQKLAAEFKLEQIEGEYKLSVDEDGKMARYEIQLPVKGSYASVRGFMNEAVRRIPNLGLRDVDLRRKNVEEGTVEARMTFVLFLLEH